MIRRLRFRPPKPKTCSIANRNEKLSFGTKVDLDHGLILGDHDLRRISVPRFMPGSIALASFSRHYANLFFYFVFVRCPYPVRVNDAAKCSFTGWILKISGRSKTKGFNLSITNRDSGSRIPATSDDGSTDYLRNEHHPMSKPVSKTCLHLPKQLTALAREQFPSSHPVRFSGIEPVLHFLNVSSPVLLSAIMQIKI